MQHRLVGLGDHGLRLGSALTRPQHLFDVTYSRADAVVYDADTGERRTIDAPWRHFSLVAFSDDDTFFGLAQRIRLRHVVDPVRAQQVVSCEVATLQCTPVSPVVRTDDAAAGRWPTFLTRAAGAARGERPSATAGSGPLGWVAGAARVVGWEAQRIFFTGGSGKAGHGLLRHCGPVTSQRQPDHERVRAVAVGPVPGHQSGAGGEHLLGRLLDVVRQRDGQATLVTHPRRRGLPGSG